MNWVLYRGELCVGHGIPVLTLLLAGGREGGDRHVGALRGLGGPHASEGAGGVVASPAARGLATCRDHGREHAILRLVQPTPWKVSSSGSLLFPQNSERNHSGTLLS